MSTIPWTEGRWTNPPQHAAEVDGALRVTAVESSDAWRHTSYGFVHDTEHALVAPLARDSAMEVEVVGDLSAPFDQAGIFVRASDEHWVKAGVEYADGALQVGAVVTDGRSDWSVAPLAITGTALRLRIRASWSGDALTIRAAIGDEPLRLVRLLPWTVEEATAGPLVCAPTRADLTVDFVRWERTDADASLH